MKPVQLLYRVVLLICLVALTVACASQSTPSEEAPTDGEATTGEEAGAADEAVTLTYLVDDSEITRSMTQALADAYVAKNPNVTINIETRPGGAEGDNLVKTRLATGDMADIFFYNSGALLQALNPSQTLVDLSGEPFIDNIVESFVPTVSQGEGIYGVPTGPAMGGGILYNKRVYEENGLSVPTTWAEFEANNEQLQAAGIAPVIASFGDTWTSQLFVLADYCNIAQEMPEFAEAYTANEIQLATTPAAVRSFSYLQQGFEDGWWQENFATTTYDQALKMIAEGESAHYPMLSFALGTIASTYPEQVDDIGFFGQPGPEGEPPCATIWMPAGTYIPKTSEHVEEAKAFLAFIASVEGADALTAKVEPQGPYLIKEATLPDDVLPAVKDMAVYIDEGRSVPALEFLSPLKGPSLEQITVAVGSGQMDAETGAANYDRDVAQQALQLGLPGWE